MEMITRPSFETELVIVAADAPEHTSDAPNTIRKMRQTRPMPLSPVWRLIDNEATKNSHAVPQSTTSPQALLRQFLMVERAKPE
jgi:hypothetical protein